MKKTNFTIASTLAALALCQMGCTGASSGASSGSATTLSLSGTLATSARSAKAGGNVAMDVDTTNLKVQAVAFTSPPTIVEADVNSDGSFSIALPNSKGAATTAYFLDKDDDSQQGVIVFEDTSSKDMNGNSSESSSVVLNGSVALGAIELGTDGKVKVPVASISSQLGSSSSVAAASTFDPTGTWYMKAFDGTVPTGYVTVGSTCGQGPCIGFPITLARFTGKAFTKSTNCDPTIKPVTCATGDGTIGTNDRYALSIWGGNYTDGIGACGDKTGFTAAEARAYAGIHIPTAPTVDGNVMSFGAYDYLPASGFGGDSSPFNKAWMRTAATLTRDLQNCRPTVVSHLGNNYNGWACRANVMSGPWSSPVPISGGSVFGWQIGVEGGGCFNTATGKPVNVTNWGTIGMGSCSQTDVSSTYGPGFMKNSCTFSSVDHDNDPGTATISLTCTNTGGQVTDSTGVPTSTPLSMGSGEYLGQPEPIALNHALCSSIGDSDDAHTLAAYRCYAESMWNGGPQPSGSCTREYHFNWSATTPGDFARDSERGKPKNAFVTNILNYSGDGQTATLEDEEIETITISTGASSSTFCKASRRTVISFKKISETRMLVDLRQSGQMNSTNAACIGAAKDALAGKNVGGGNLQHILTPENMLFYADTTL